MKFVHAMTPAARNRTSAIVRGIQALCALIAFSATAAGNHHKITSASVFTIVVTFFSTLLSLGYLIGVHKTNMLAMPPVRIQRAVDGVYALFLLIAAIVLSQSKHVDHSSNLQAGVAFTVFTFIAMVASVGLTYVPTEAVKDTDKTEFLEQGGVYKQQFTPRTEPTAACASV